MSTKKQTAVKPADKATAKKAAPAAATSKAKPAAEKAIAVTPVKKAPSVVAETDVQLKKNTDTDKVGKDKMKDSMKKTSAANNTTPESKKKAEIAEEVKTAAPTKAKSAKQEPAPAPVKKAETVKQPEPVVAKKVPAKKAEPEVPVKKVAKAEVKPAPAPAPAPVKAPTKPASSSSRKTPPAPVKKVIQARSALIPPRPTPTPTPAARPVEKKPQVIIAHRKLENKSRPAQNEEMAPAYQPEVYRSLLDEPVIAPVTVYRYNDEELAEFKELITNRLEAARKELIYLQGVITRKDEAGTEDTENRYMNMEDGSGAMEREQLAQLASRQIQFVNHLEKALIRIENKTYGVCRVTGKLIEKARLRAVPHATLSIEAKKMMNTKQN
jgi:RNA polymerase-binding transcription factor DksA